MDEMKQNTLGELWHEEGIAALSLLPVAAYNAYANIKARYQRTTLGPFWLTISAGVTILILGLIWGSVFNADLTTFFPYVTVGFITWSFISTLIMESPLLFFEQSTIMKNIKLPIFYYISMFLIKNLVIYAHNFVIIALVLIIFQVPITINTLLFLPNLIFLVAIAYFCVVILGIMASRYHDIHPIINSITMLIFLMTPILWEPTAVIGKRAFLVEFNPFFHFIQLIREPLLGRVPTMMNYLFSVSMLIIAGAIAIYLLKKYRHRLVFWV